jgi:hypothetical protein
MKGARLKLSPGRRFIADLSWLAKGVPQGVVRRTISVAAAQAARAGAEPRIPWVILLAKAYGLAAAASPTLRRSYARLPWPHLFEAERSVASIMIERDWGGETAVLYARIKHPDEKPLVAMAAELEALRAEPVEKLRSLRSMRIANRMPLLVRRLLWWWMFNSGSQRGTFFGTFGITTLGARGVSMNYPVSPVTAVLVPGPFMPDGTMELTLGFDHRVMDGSAVADALDALELHLCTTVADELRAMPQRPPG